MSASDLSSASEAEESALSEAEEAQAFAAQTSFDLYFNTISKPSRTSTNVFSDLISPLTPAEYKSLIAAFDKTIDREAKLKPLETDHTIYFTQYIGELTIGFNIVFYGLGSKRSTINQFIDQQCRKRGHIVCVNGFYPGLTIRDIIASICQIPGVSAQSSTLPGMEGEVRRICSFFAASARPLFLVIHNIDSGALRTIKAKAILAQLAAQPRIHVVASIDHINAPLIWSQSEMTKRKTDGSKPGFAWIWHDLTTLQPYGSELSFINHTSVKQPKGGATDAGRSDPIASDGTIEHMSETAAQHILASVTAKAKKLFVVLGKRQLASLAEAGRVVEGTVVAAQQHGTSNDVLLSAARDDFIAQSNTALKALLGEFKDHGLVISVGTSDSGDVLWIPLRKEHLISTLDGLAE